MARANNADFRWHVIKTARFRERYVGTQLGQFSGAEVYVPLVKVPKRCLRPGHSQIEPLFPGYVFARLNLPTQLPVLRRVRAFGSLVSFDGRPAIVDLAVIREMRRRERGRGYTNLGVQKQELRAEETVRVVRGSFSGLVGRFLRYLDGMERIRILLEILNTKAVLELPAQAVAATAGTRRAGYESYL